MRVILLSAIAILMSGCAATPRTTVPGDSASREAFAAATTVKDDGLDTIADVESPASVPPMFSEGSLNTRTKLRAFIDKRTGLAKYQVFAVIEYQAQNWHNFARMNFARPAGPESVPVEKIDGQVLACAGAAGCEFLEQVAADMSEKDLRAAAAAGTPWAFKFVGQDGNERAFTFSAAKVAGFLDRIDTYQAGKVFALSK